jgi:hypothetical protein
MSNKVVRESKKIYNLFKTYNSSVKKLQLTKLVVVNKKRMKYRTIIIIRYSLRVLLVGRSVEANRSK